MNVCFILSQLATVKWKLAELNKLVDDIHHSPGMESVSNVRTVREARESKRTMVTDRHVATPERPESHMQPSRMDIEREQHWTR